MALSTTSNTIWGSPVPSSVSPMYIPGRLRTASHPFNTLILLDSYSRACSACGIASIDHHDLVHKRVMLPCAGDCRSLQARSANRIRSTRTRHRNTESRHVSNGAMFHVEHSVGGNTIRHQGGVEIGDKTLTLQR